MPVEASSTSTTAQSSVRSTTADKQGFNGLTADDFFKLLIAQLQNQDPTEPTSNQELLQQISTIRGVQANSEISTTLKELTSVLGGQQSLDGQRLSVAASFIDKTVTLRNNQIGVVQSAFLQDGNSFVVVNGRNVPVSDVLSVTPPQSFVGRTISASIVDNGKQKVVFGEVSEVFEANGQLNLTLNRMATEGADKGRLTPQYNVPMTSVREILSYDSFINRRVSALSVDGHEVSGKAIAATETVGGKPAYLVGGVLVPANGILSIDD